MVNCAICVSLGKVLISSEMFVNITWHPPSLSNVVIVCAIAYVISAF